MITEVIILTFIFYLLYKIYYNIDSCEGKWIEVKEGDFLQKDNKKILYDISDNSMVFYPCFSKFNIFNYSTPYIVLGENESVYMSFKIYQNNHHNISIYDSDLNILQSINNPISLTFTSINKGDKEINKNIYLEKGKKYLIFLRSNITENYVQNKLIKYFKEVNFVQKDIYNLGSRIYTKELNLREEMDMRCKKIKEEMRKKEYNLKEILYSEEYFSFPNTDYATKREIICKKNEKVIVVCVNKQKTIHLKNHLVEINTPSKSMNWFPRSKENITQLLLTNEDEEMKFSFFERLYGVTKSSDIIPFRVLVFN